MIESLTQEKLVVILDGWAGQEVAVRVVTEANDLLAVFCGELGSQSGDKHPALFWPLLPTERGEHRERPGVYLHPERFEEASLHEGGFVLELRQQGVTLNLRRL